MRRKKGEGCSRRERLEVTVTALIPAALGLLTPTMALAGRLSWLGPWLALPVGICLCLVWGRLGRADLGRGLEEAFGRTGGKLAATGYFLWTLVLLADAARGYSERLLTISEGEGARWLFLLTALGLCLWLGRGRAEAFARAGRMFFLAVAVTLGAIFLLTLPGVNWKNLWPPEEAEWRELPGSAALCLSLTGYGVYALCLPGREEDGRAEGAWSWVIWSCGGLSALLFLVVGTFGPALAGGLKEPFLYLLEGVRVPGAFRRGEAALTAVLTLGDLTLLALLSRGAADLWRRLVPVFPALGWIPVGAAFALAGALPGMNRVEGRLWAALPAGNLILGVLIPTLSVLTIRARERRKRQAIFCGDNSERKEDVAVKWADKKSGGENEKKC